MTMRDSIAIERALHEVDDSLVLLAAWPEPASPAAATLRPAAMFVVPTIRLAGLRHWDDEPLLPAPFGGVQALEASKWARLVLKGHGGAIGTLLDADGVHDPRGAAAALRPIAARCVDATVDAWCEAAGVPRLPASEAPLVGAARFDAVNAWLETLRAQFCA
jgi:hypothetical protein